MWHDPRAMNALSLTLTILSLAALLWAAGGWLVRQPSFMFRQVVVRDVQRADSAHVAAVIRHELRGTFFTMDLDNARRALQQVPWVRNAGLQREWPDRMEVTIEEFKPFAHWNASSLVTHDGVVFDAPYDGELPELAGNDGEALAVIERFETWTTWLASLGLELRAVRHSARDSWQIVVVKEGKDGGNGSADGSSGGQTIELGRDNVDARLERFVSVYKKTVGPLARAGLRSEYIDLRYQNGLAVRVGEVLPVQNGRNGASSARSAGTTGRNARPNSGQPRR